MRPLLLILALLLIAPSARAQDLGELFGNDGLPDAIKVGSGDRGRLELLQRDGWTILAISGGIEATGTQPATRKQPRRTFQLLADRAVVWTPPGANPDDRASVIRAIYAEGHVLASYSEDEVTKVRVEAERAFFDLKNGRALLIGSRTLVTPQADPTQSGLEQEPVIITAERLSALGASELVGSDVTVTTCEFGDPHYRLLASELRITVDQEPYPAAMGALGGAVAPLDFTNRTAILSELVAARLDDEPVAQASARPVDIGTQDAPVAEGSDALSDRTAALKEEPRWIELKHLRAELWGVPFLYLPAFTWKSTWDFLPTAGYGSSSAFGNFYTLDWDIPLTAPDRAIVDGKRVRHGLKSSLRAGILHSTRRGTAESAGIKWRYYDEGEEVSRGRVEGTYLRDEGRDQTGTMLERQDRGWFRFAEQSSLAERWRFDSEVSYLSDRGYLLEFEERTAKTDKQQETYLYTHYRWQNLFLSGLARFRINDFEDYVERLPEVTADLLSQPLFDNPLIGGQATVSWDATYSYLRLRPDSGRFNTPTQEINRFDSRFEVDDKVPLGPFILRGFAAGRFTAWDHTRLRQGGTERVAAEAGLNLATTLHRKYGERYTHAIVPEIGYTNRFLNTRDPAELILVDEVESVRETEFLFLRGRTRLSVQGLDEEGRPSLDYYDLIDLAVETRYFPKANKDNARDNFGALFADLRLYQPGRFRARLRVEADPSRGRIITNESFVDIFAMDGLVIGASYRDLDDVSEALGWNITWEISDKWALRLEEQYDFLTSRFTMHRATFRRRFHKLSVDFALSVDPGEDDVTFSVQLAPDLFGSNSDPFQSGRLSGLGF